MPIRNSRRQALKSIVAGVLGAPFLSRAVLGAPVDRVRHASFGANGMALADIRSLAASKNFQLVAVAEVDLGRVADVKRLFPDVHVYQDWRELLDKEKGLDSANISTPDHMHAPITMRAMQQGIHVYTQKPLTQSIHEARALTQYAAKHPNLVTQMGIQIHSHPVHKSVVATIQSGVIGKIKEVHSWSGKQWGDRAPRPMRMDKAPKSLNWDQWLGVAQDRPFLNGYYHPGEWRKRLDFGTGTFGDMGCHILDPVFAALALPAPSAVRSEGDPPNADSWGLDVQVKFDFPGSKFTTPSVSLTWYNGNNRPPKELAGLIGGKYSDQGSVYIGTEGVLSSPYIADPKLFPTEKYPGNKIIRVAGDDHYVQFIDACRGVGKTSAPFSFAGPLTESVLLGCLATRFPKTTLQWDSAELKITNETDANPFVRKTYRKGWEVEGL